MTAYTGGMPTFTAGVKTGNAARLNQLRDLGRAFTDAWSAYTPTLTASTTNPTGWTQTGSWMQAGKLVHVKGTLLAGASMTPGSGTYRIALPVAAQTALGNAVLQGSIYLYDQSAAVGSTLFVAYTPAAGYAQMIGSAGGAVTTISNTAPWAWAANDTVQFAFCYEAA